MENPRFGSHAITHAIRVLNKQCASSKRAVHLRQFHRIPLGECVIIVDIDWTEEDSEEFFKDGTLPEVSDEELEQDGRPLWFFDITQRWTALPKVKFEVVPDIDQNPASICLVGLEGDRTRICYVPTEQLNMKMVGEKEVQFAWKEDGMSSLYYPTKKGLDLVDVVFSEKEFNLRDESTARSRD